jgi:hypothetical protein
MSSIYGHLGLSQWPFAPVPTKASCDFMAGRNKLRDEIATLLRGLTRRDPSSIHVLWSWFGAGKTHSLYYMANQATANSAPNQPILLLPVYTEFPKGARGFSDLYRSFFSELPSELLVDAFLELQTSPAAEDLAKSLPSAYEELSNALRVMAMGDQIERSLASRWLRGEPITAAETKRVGLPQRVRSSEQATRLLSAAIRLLGAAARSGGAAGQRVIWMIDEFQRITLSGKQAAIDINTGLHSLFNATPTHLSLVISFSGSPSSTALPNWFTPELRDRIGTTRVMILPPLQPDEALAFVKEVLQRYRIPGTHAAEPFFPFTEASCRAILRDLAKRAEVKPRSIMQVFNAVLEAAEPQLARGPAHPNNHIRVCSCGAFGVRCAFG